MADRNVYRLSMTDDVAATAPSFVQQRTTRIHIRLPAAFQLVSIIFVFTSRHIARPESAYQSRSPDKTAIRTAIVEREIFVAFLVTLQRGGWPTWSLERVLRASKNDRRAVDHALGGRGTRTREYYTRTHQFSRLRRYHIRVLDENLERVCKRKNEK